MKSFIGRMMLAIIAVIFVLTVSACASKDKGNENKEGSKDSGAPPERNEISVRSADDPDFLDPHLMQASITEQIFLNVFEGLLAPKTDGTLKPAIAEDYNISEDGLTYTFNIRENVTFHNGDPVTVDDIKYSFERLTNPDEPLSENFVDVESLKTPDESTFVITLSKMNSTFLTFLTAKDAAIIPESNDEQHNDNPIGTGPFKFISYSPGSNLIIGKNEDYWIEGIPYLDEVTFVFQADDEATFMGLQAGELDIITIPPHRIPEVEADYHLEYQDNNSTVLIGLNHEREPFNDLKVRQAINYAINKDDVIEATYSGYATKIGSNMSPAMGVFYKKGLEDVYDQDIEKAKKLLAEAGYPDGFSTTISLSSHTERYADIAQVAVENLKEIGIEAEIEVVEWGVWLERIYQGRDYEMTVIDFTGKLSAYDILDRYISDAGNNFLNYDNEEYDKLLAEVKEVEDIDEQLEIYHRAQEILSEDAAAVYLADYQFVWAMNPDLEGYKMYPIFFQDLSEVRFKE